MNKELLKIRKVKIEDARGWFTLVNKVWRDAYHHIFPEKVFIDKENRIEEKIKNFKDKMQNNNHSIAYVAEYDGDIIGVKGRIQTRKYEIDEEHSKFVTEVVAEKVTFLSSKKKADE